ncbi:MAG: VWA domain-containing protein [Myxococcaceae bacterium]|nr:VWA domain-containing protein [Myxococcaceae bacterium]
MTFGFPLGLVALAAAAPILVAYFLRRKQPPRVVSALFLWRSPDQRAEAGPKLQRFSREVSLLLELCAVVAAAAFLSDAHCGGGASKKHLVAVVDGSLSMQAKSGGKTAADRVRDQLAKLVGAEGVGQLTLIESGLKPTVLAGPQAEVSRALADLERWVPSQPAHDVGPALLVARELAGGKGNKVHFLTDGPLAEGALVPPEVEVLSVGEPVDNVALLSAQRTDVEGEASVTVRVANFSKAERTVVLQLGPRTREVELAAGGTSVVQAKLPAAGPIVVALPDDALAIDGNVTLLPSPPPATKVVLLGGLDPNAGAALRRALAVVPGVTVSTALQPDSLTVGPPGSSAEVTLGAAAPPKSYLGPFFAQKGNPLLEDVQLSGAIWTAGPNPVGRSLMSAGDAVLIAEEEDGRLHFNLDVGRSNVQRTVAWPILVSNLVRRARLSLPGLPRRHLMLGEDVPVTTAPGAAYVLKGPGALQRPVLGVGPVTLPAVTVPGRWALWREGEEVDALEVLPLDPRESDLRSRGPYTVKASAAEGLASIALKQPRSLWPLVVLLALLLVDYWVTARGGAR